MEVYGGREVRVREEEEAGVYGSRRRCLWGRQEERECE